MSVDNDRRRLRLAVIGVGGMAHWQHLPNLCALADQAQVVAVVDEDNEALADTTARYSICHAFTSVHDLLRARLDLQAALVITPAPHHAAPAIELMQAGLPVFCEKPLAYCLDEAEEIVRVAEETGTIFMVGFNRRFAATIRAAKETLTRVRPELIFVEKCRPMQTIAGPRLIEVCIHVLDTLRWLAGSEVTGLQVLSTTDASSKVEQSIAALMHFENGVIGVFAMNANGAKPIERVEVYADVATLIVEYPVRLRRFMREHIPLSDELAAVLISPPSELEIGHIDEEPVLQLAGTLCPVDEVAALGFLGELEHFLACVRSHSQPLTSGAEALATQRLAHWIYREMGLA